MEKKYLIEKFLVIVEIRIQTVSVCLTGKEWWQKRNYLYSVKSYSSKWYMADGHFVPWQGQGQLLAYPAGCLHFSVSHDGVAKYKEGHDASSCFKCLGWTVFINITSADTCLLVWLLSPDSSFSNSVLISSEGSHSPGTGLMLDVQWTTPPLGQGRQMSFKEPWALLMACEWLISAGFG